MRKRNLFLTAALEAAAPSSAEVDDIHYTDTLQPKPGVGEGDDVDSSYDLDVDGEVGEGSPFAEFDEIDVVAESQETTLALESLSASAHRFMAYASALEEIASTIEAGAENGETVSPTTAALLTTALDGAGIGEPLSETVALESFDFSSSVATENFVDDLKERAKKVASAIASFAKKAADIVKAKLKRFADWFRKLPKIVEKLEKEIEATEGYVGTNFASEKYEKKAGTGFYAPASSRNISEVVRGTLAEYEKHTALVDGKFFADIKAMERSVNTGTAEEIVNSMNKTLVSLRTVLRDNNDAKYGSSDVFNNLPEKFVVGKLSGMSKNAITLEERDTEGLHGLKIAGPKDLAVLKDVALKAQRAFGSNTDALMFDSFVVTLGNRQNEGELGFINNYKLVAAYRSMAFSCVNAWAWCEASAATALFMNVFRATGWIRASIADSRARRRTEAA